MKYGRYVILISIFASVLQAKIIFNDHPLNPLEVRDILQELRHEYGWSKRQTVLFFAVGMHESQTFKFRCAPTARSYNDLVPINTQKNGKCNDGIKLLMSLNIYNHMCHYHYIQNRSYTSWSKPSDEELCGE